MFCMAAAAARARDNVSQLPAGSPTQQRAKHPQSATLNARPSHLCRATDCAQVHVLDTAAQMQAVQALPPGAAGLSIIAAASKLPGTISAALGAYSALRGCANHHWLPAAAAATGGASRAGVSARQPAAPANAVASRSSHGNVYPPLTVQQLEAMRTRRLAANCDPAALLARPVASAHDHQTKHIMVCSGATCKAACGSCLGSGASQAALGDRTWEYLRARLKEVNQLRAEDDETPILFSRIDCTRAKSLLPPLAATEPCHGPIAVVLPEGVWYERLSPLVLERIIEEHLLGGRLVKSHVMSGSRHAGRVTPALDITRRANPTAYDACHYAW